jgi:hypothetical protein
MLTEYSSYDDIRKFRDKAISKLLEMKSNGGWLHKKIRRYVIKIKGQKTHAPAVVTLKVNNQEVLVAIFPSSNNKTDRLSHLIYVLSVTIETNKGKNIVILGDGEIKILSPHFAKRIKERSVFYKDVILGNSKTTKYIRNGKEYELSLVDNSVYIARRPCKDIVHLITFLTKDMCTSKNYQELFERAGKAIDEHDIYEWK